MPTILLTHVPIMFYGWGLVCAWPGSILSTKPLHPPYKARWQSQSAEYSFMFLFLPKTVTSYQHRPSPFSRSTERGKRWGKEKITGLEKIKPQMNKSCESCMCNLSHQDLQFNTFSVFLSSVNPQHVLSPGRSWHQVEKLLFRAVGSKELIREVCI